MLFFIHHFVSSERPQAVAQAASTGRLPARTMSYWWPLEGEVGVNFYILHLS